MWPVSSRNYNWKQAENKSLFDTADLEISFLLKKYEVKVQKAIVRVRFENLIQKWNKLKIEE